MKYIIGETYKPEVYIADSLVDPTYLMVRLSDGKIWDVTNSLWTLTPVNPNATMTESTYYTYLYTASLDTNFLTEDTEILFIYSNPGVNTTERVSFEKDTGLDVLALAVFDRDTEHTTLSCIGRVNQEIILTPAQVSFSILSHAGAVLLEPIVEDTSVNGILTTTTSLFNPSEGTGYILEVVYEYESQSYSFAFPFSVI